MVSCREEGGWWVVGGRFEVIVVDGRVVGGGRGW
jgi:hypothetical protein